MDPLSATGVSDDPAVAAFRGRVRGTALWAAIGGGLMLCFGIGDGIIPQISPAYTVAANVYIATLRVGGAAMLGVAALCLTGWSGALLIDAVACAAITVGLAFPGVVFVSNGEANGILSLVFGLLFGSAGARSWVEYRERPRQDVPAAPRTTESAGAPSAPLRLVGAGDHSVHRVMQMRASREACSEAPPEPQPSTPPVDAEPEGGFLAALGREEDEKQHKQP